MVELLLREENPDSKLKLTARNPYPSGYKPELNVTLLELSDQMTSFFGVDGKLAFRQSYWAESMSLLKCPSCRSTKCYHDKGILRLRIIPLSHA